MMHTLWQLLHLAAMAILASFIGTWLRLMLVVAIALALSIALVYRGCKALSDAAGNDIYVRNLHHYCASFGWVLLLPLSGRADKPNG